MDAIMTTHDEETDQNLHHDHVVTAGLENAPKGRAGEPEIRRWSSTLMERVVGFMESYKGCWYA